MFILFKFKLKDVSQSVSISPDQEIYVASIFHALSTISKQISPVPSDSKTFKEPLGIKTLEADSFKVHCLETYTGMRFLGITKPEVKDITKFLQSVYEIYTDAVLKNPFYDLDMPIRLELFDRQLERVLADIRSAIGFAT